MVSRTLWQRARRNTLFRNTSWLLLAEGGRLLIQGFSFVLLGRALGPQGIGAFLAAQALVFLFVPFAAWGSGFILMKHVARTSSSFSVYWGNALVTILVSSSLLILFARSLGAWLVPNLPLGLVLVLAIAELFFAKVLEISGQAFRAFERASVTAQLSLLLGIFRLVASVLFINTSSEPNAQNWGTWYLAATALAAVIGYIRVHHSFGAPTPIISLIPKSLGEGWGFSLNLASATIYNSIDKTMLARLATLEASGIYAAAYRIIDLAYTPVKSFVAATYPRFFKEGTTGIGGSLALVRRLLPFSITYGLTTTLGLLVLAPLMPYVLGDEYKAAVYAIRLLALIPFFRSLHNFAASVLTSAGYQGIRSAVQVSVAILNVLLNLWLIPRYSWHGAAWASLVSDGALVLVLWPVIWFLSGRTRGVARASAHE